MVVLLVSCKKEATIKPVKSTPTQQAASVIGNAKFYYLAEPLLNIGSGVLIYINGIYKGKITSAPTSIPNCDNLFGFNYADTSKTYNYIAKVIDAFPSSHNFIKTGTFHILADSCIKINTHP